MDGTVEGMSLADAREDQHSSQSRLSAFNQNGSDSTYIGIVQSPNDDFESVIDEQIPELAPPEELFYQWLQTRKSLESDGMGHIEAHNTAVERVDYESRFKQYLHDDAHSSVASLATRVRNGEHIVLVCYCHDGKWCHRDLVIEAVMGVATKQQHA
jgi:uncharacterized protein YeaO (DUF488 family)